MSEIINLFGEPCEDKPKKPINKDRRNWQRRFQNWSNNASMDGSTSQGKCGYGFMCDCCTDNHYGNPCVRALNCMLREKGLTIDYKNAEFEEIWNGTYFRK
jgi:hypothetical protein